MPATWAAELRPPSLQRRPAPPDSMHCAADQLCFVFVRGALFMVFSLIATPTIANAERILGIAVCRRDAWTKLFLQRFPDPISLISGDARACLIAMAVLLRWEITRQECRHRQLRRLCRANETWLLLLHQISAQFLLLRHRVLERVLRPKPKPTPVQQSRRCKDGKKRKRKGKTGKHEGHATGGGGGQRAFISVVFDWLQIHK